jgi:hypothetical protein
MAEQIAHQKSQRLWPFAGKRRYPQIFAIFRDGGGTSSQPINARIIFADRRDCLESAWLETVVSVYPRHHSRVTAIKAPINGVVNASIAFTAKRKFYPVAHTREAIRESIPPHLQ